MKWSAMQHPAGGTNEEISTPDCVRSRCLSKQPAERTSNTPTVCAPSEAQRKALWWCSVRELLALTPS